MKYPRPVKCTQTAPGMYHIEGLCPCDNWRWGLLCRLGSFWVGWHWSPYNRRLCVNLMPCVTIWVAPPGGKEP